MIHIQNKPRFNYLQKMGKHFI